MEPRRLFIDCPAVCGACEKALHAQWIHELGDSSSQGNYGFCSYRSVWFGGASDPVTLSTEFKKYGWEVTGSPKSSRAVGWQLMKSLLYQAGSDEPGLYISERCESLWATLPYCISDDRNPEDMEKTAPDYSADAVRYVLTAANQAQQSYRQSQRSGAHPLMWGNEQKPRRYSGGVRTYKPLPIR